MRIWISIHSQLLELYGDNSELIASLCSFDGDQRRRRTQRQLSARRAAATSSAPRSALVHRRTRCSSAGARPAKSGRPELAEANPGRDWILTRILWLSGREPGFNRLGDVDTMRRYIYLHGSPDTVEMGVPGSIGCIRMQQSRHRRTLRPGAAAIRRSISSNSASRRATGPPGRLRRPGARNGVRRRAGRAGGHGIRRCDPISLHVAGARPAGEADRHRATAARRPHRPHGGAAGLARQGRRHRAVAAPAWTPPRKRGIEHLALNAQTIGRGFYRRFGFAHGRRPSSWRPAFRTSRCAHGLRTLGQAESETGCGRAGCRLPATSVRRIVSVPPRLTFSTVELRVP